MLRGLVVGGSVVLRGSFPCEYSGRFSLFLCSFCLEGQLNKDLPLTHILKNIYLYCSSRLFQFSSEIFLCARSYLSIKKAFQPPFLF